MDSRGGCGRWETAPTGGAGLAAAESGVEARGNSRLAELGRPRKGRGEGERARGRKKANRAESEEGREKRKKFLFFFQINFQTHFQKVFKTF